MCINQCLCLPKAELNTKTNPNGHHSVAVWVRFIVQLHYLRRLKSVPSDAENRVCNSMFFLVQTHKGFAPNLCLSSMFQKQTYALWNKKKLPLPIVILAILTATPNLSSLLKPIRMLVTIFTIYIRRYTRNVQIMMTLLFVMLSPAKVNKFLSSKSSWTPKTQPNDSRAAVGWVFGVQLGLRQTQ